MIRKISFNDKKKNKKITITSSVVAKKNKLRPIIKNVYDPIYHINQDVDEYWDDEDEDYEFAEE